MKICSRNTLCFVQCKINHPNTVQPQDKVVGHISLRVSHSVSAILLGEPIKADNV